LLLAKFFFYVSLETNVSINLGHLRNKYVDNNNYVRTNHQKDMRSNLNVTRSKEAFDILEKYHDGSDLVKQVKLQYWRIK